MPKRITRTKREVIKAEVGRLWKAYRDSVKVAIDHEIALARCQQLRGTVPHIQLDIMYYNKEFIKARSHSADYLRWYERAATAARKYGI